MDSGHPRLRRACSWLAAVILGSFFAAAAQQPGPTTADTSRDAMSKLSFLVGRWSGPLTVVRGPGEPLHLTQSESVEYKLDGLVLLVEGKSTDAGGHASFAALATIAWDEATRGFRIRAYHDGHYVDTELTVNADGFSWGFDSGPAHVVNRMHLTPQHEWAETTEVAMGANPPRKTVDMLLARQP